MCFYFKVKFTVFVYICETDFYSAVQVKRIIYFEESAQNDLENRIFNSSSNFSITKLINVRVRA